MTFVDYVVQISRYQIVEEAGCTNAVGSFGLELLWMESAPVLFPLVSLIFYARKYYECVVNLVLTEHSKAHLDVFQD